jgi:hypothetical protein
MLCLTQCSASEPKKFSLHLRAVAAGLAPLRSIPSSRPSLSPSPSLACRHRCRAAGPAAAAPAPWPPARAVVCHAARQDVQLQAATQEQHGTPAPGAPAAPDDPQQQPAREPLNPPPHSAGAPAEASGRAEGAPGAPTADDWLQRTRLLVGEEGLARLAGTNVLLVGLGGVGSYTAEFLARAGVGSLTIVDGGWQRRPACPACGRCDAGRGGWAA